MFPVEATAPFTKFHTILRKWAFIQLFQYSQMLHITGINFTAITGFFIWQSHYVFLPNAIINTMHHFCFIAFNILLLPGGPILTSHSSELKCWTLPILGRHWTWKWISSASIIPKNITVAIMINTDVCTCRVTEV